MPDEFDALLGIGMDDPRMMSDALRRKHLAGEMSAATTIPTMQRGGARTMARTLAGAKQAGVLESKRKENALRRTLAANKRDQTYKSGTPEAYVKGDKKMRAYFDFDDNQYHNVDGHAIVDLNGWKKSRADKEYTNVPDKLISNVANLQAGLATVTELKNTFDASYATQESEMPLEKQAKIYVAKIFPTMMEDEIVAGADWWRNKSKFYDLVDRHELFGGALTRTEIKSWVDANIGVRNTPAQVMSSLDKLIEKVEAKLTKSENTFAMQGYDPKHIDALYTQPREQLRQKWEVQDEPIQPEPDQKVAPNNALMMLQANDSPEVREQFFQKYGYLPQGFEIDA